MITLTAFVVLFGLGAGIYKLAGMVRRAVRTAGDQHSAAVARSA